MNRAALAAVVLAALPAPVLAVPLPAHLDLASPFPTVTLQAAQLEHIAPGIEYGDYELWSDVGPISIHVVAADLANPSVRAETVLSGDLLTSDGETVTSMAQRTNAVAGINGDYFDIGQTNQPTNIVIRNGELLRTPRQRYGLAILRGGGAHFAEFSFTGSVQIASQSFPLSAVNELPSSQDDLTLLTPAFGPVDAAPGVTLVSLTLTNGSPPLATYRVDAFAQSDDGAQPAGYYLAVGSGAGVSALPSSGDAIAIAGTLAPIALDQIADAIGGGPLLLYNGAWFDDPDGPNGGEFERRIPCSGAATANDGTLFLIEVDGRQPERSVGLTRPEFAQLMIALGARNGIALDGGGSSTLTAQLLGESEAEMQNAPSDGTERRVADGLFLYNDAPIGPPSRLASSPEVVRSVVGAAVALHVDAVDASDHAMAVSEPIAATVSPSSLGRVVGERFIASQAGNGTIVLRAGSLTGSIPLEVSAAPARIVLLPQTPNVDPHGSLALHARAFDAAGFEIALPERLAWATTSGNVDPFGHFVAGDGNADVSLTIGTTRAWLPITVGSHESALDLGMNLHFLSFPAGGPGDARLDDSCEGCVRLTYALGPNERAAYAVVEHALPSGTVGLAFDVEGDASGAELRVALRNAINEQVLVTAVVLDRPGLRHVTVRFPPDLTDPLRLVGFYTIPTHAAPSASGSVVISDVHALIAGSR